MTTKPDVAPELTADEIATERARLGIPESGDGLRSWLRYKLQQIDNPKTGRKYTQADIARKTKATEGTVSKVFRDIGTGLNGRMYERIRLVTAEILGIDARIIWPTQKQGAPTSE